MKTYIEYIYKHKKKSNNIWKIKNLIRFPFVICILSLIKKKPQQALPLYNIMRALFLKP